MARALLVGCGCRGRQLGARLLADGWAVRGTSRSAAGLEAISDRGIEPARADPDRLGTVIDQIGDVTVLAWLLGSVDDAARAADLNGPRLESLLERLVDSPVRGFVYERAGSTPAAALEVGAGLVAAAAERWRIPVRILDSDPREPPAWVAAAHGAIISLVG